MAGELTFSEIANLGKERVAEKAQFTGETKYPLAKYLFGKSKKPLDEQGRRMAIITRRPGGHNAYSQASTDFRTPTPLDSDSMRVYPVWYQIGGKLNGASLRALKSGSENQLLKYREMVGMITDAAKKRLNHYFHGDGTGALAVCANAAINGTGSKTFTAQTLATSATGEAETKGVVRLEVGHQYALIDTDGVTINAVFTVTSKTSGSVAVVNVTTSNATSASGDYVVDAGISASTSSNKKAPAGFRSLCAASGVVQNFDRANDANTRTPRVNGNDLPITPYVFGNAKALVNIAANDMNEAEGKLIIAPIGQELLLRIQQFGYRQYQGNENVKGVAGKYIDADGDTYLFDSDAAEDRIYIVDGNSFYLGEEKPFGFYSEDGQELRMLSGTNSVGSDAFFFAIGWGGNLIKDVSESRFQCDAFIDRLSQTDQMTQVSLG
jgi:hypothetical protein